MSAPQAPAQSPAHTNALIHETSPYLLQHAHNPIDWHAWSPETIELARKADKPIFLSVGYSTCYWCHVMERESFESDKIAAIMNEHFINIKVDREERPDVDDIYMSAVQAMSGQGGWPMSVFLEPHTLRPFYGGTYFPAEPMYGRQSFPQLLEAIANVWKTQREMINEQAARVAEAVTQRELSSAKPQAVGRQQVQQAIELLKRIYDREHGGFGRAPKFPQPVFLELLIGAAWDDDEARAMLLHTLDRMAIGGMYDQIGGGFHRYSTDERWLVPHFEKMLYDQGQLVSVYAEAYERTKDEFYAEIVRETLNYVLREMTSPEGGFFSAQDAEVDAREGLNYLWLPEQIASTLREAGLENDTDFTLQVYGLTQGTNFRDPHHPEDGPKNVVFLVDRPDALAKSVGMPREQFNERLARVNAVLLQARSQRKQPRTDDKVLAGWNGMMIAAFADGSRVLHDDAYGNAAKHAAEFVLERMRRPDGGLLRTWRDGRAKIDAFLEDYALMIRGLLALHRATGEAWHLHKAVELYDLARRDFWDEARDGFFDTLADRPDLFIRTRGSYDGAVPSGNGVMALNLIDLHRRTGDGRFLRDAQTTIASVSGAIAENPLSTALATLAVHHVGSMDAAKQPLGDEGAKAKPARDPVAIAVTPRDLELDGDLAAVVEITLTIAPGHHVNAHRPGRPDLVALQLQLQDGGGLELDVTYPEGERFGDGILVHHGRARIVATLRPIGAVSGEPRLVLTYQACTDRACLRPATVELPVRIRARGR